jgi:hypothetical protein
MIYPEKVTPELDEVLGWTLMKCAEYAPIFRAAGHDIPRKVEREQAFVLHWLIKLVLLHGAQWRQVAIAELQALMASPRPVPTASPVVAEQLGIAPAQVDSFTQAVDQAAVALNQPGAA